MDILKIMQDRYSCKSFDETKKLNDEQLGQISELLRLSPSSTNLQPWRFIIATSDSAKEKIAKSAEKYPFNLQKIMDASAVIIFAGAQTLNAEHLEAVLEKEDMDGRFANSDIKQQNHAGRKFFAEMHQNQLGDFKSWAVNQVYLNLGTFVLGTAAMGLDSLVMEGLDMSVLDFEFGLENSGYESCVVVAVGYGAPDDYNRGLPKSRLSKDDIIQII